jgi:hypothetical protein
VKKGRKGGVHRKRRPRRALPGMLLHLVGSLHRWFQDERWKDLLVVLDEGDSREIPCLSSGANDRKRSLAGKRKGDIRPT